MCSVEELVLGHYRDQGYTEGNSFFLVLLVRHHLMHSLIDDMVYECKNFDLDVPVIICKMEI